MRKKQDRCGTDTLVCAVSFGTVEKFNAPPPDLLTSSEGNEAGNVGRTLESDSGGTVGLESTIYVSYATSSPV